MGMFIGQALRGEILCHLVMVSTLAFYLPLIDLFLYVCYHIEICLAVVFFLIWYISFPNRLGGLGHRVIFCPVQDSIFGILFICQSLQWEIMWALQL